MRGGASTSVLQLAEVQVFDRRGTAIPINGIHSVSHTPSEYAQQGVESLFDGDPTTKWVDAGFGTDRSVSLELYLPAGSLVTSYAFTTANDNSDRDPSSWTVDLVEGMRTVNIATESGAELPDARGASSSSFWITSPPSPPVPPPMLPPVGVDFGIIFSATRNSNPQQLVDGIQLSEITLLDASGSPVTVAYVSNPGGSNDPDDTEGAMSLIDGDTSTKWFDANFVSSDGTFGSELRFHVGAVVDVQSYTFTTANDATDRDPGCWSFGYYHQDNFVSTSSRCGVAPDARETGYPASYVVYVPSVGVVFKPLPSTSV